MGGKRTSIFRHSRESGNLARQEKCVSDLELIDAANPGWRDLAEDFGFPPLG
jgi:hypothetical protein